MGQDPSDVGAMSAEPEQKTPEQVRREIEETRIDLGDTAAALGAKSDVKGRAKDRIEEIKSNVTGKKDEFAGKASAAAPDSAGNAATQVRATVRSNPAPSAAIGALLIGFALGRLSARR